MRLKSRKPIWSGEVVVLKLATEFPYRLSSAPNGSSARIVAGKDGLLSNPCSRRARIGEKQGDGCCDNRPQLERAHC
jgi:hypothetical protein